MDWVKNFVSGYVFGGVVRRFWTHPSALRISLIQRMLQSTLFSADKIKIVVKMDGHVIFFDQSDSMKLSFCSSTSSTFTTILVRKNPPDISLFVLKSVQLPIFGFFYKRILILIMSLDSCCSKDTKIITNFMPICSLFSERRTQMFKKKLAQTPFYFPLRDHIVLKLCYIGSSGVTFSGGIDYSL